MLRNLLLTDVEALCQINVQALGYSFSTEKTAQQLAKLTKDTHHFSSGLKIVRPNNCLVIFMQKFTSHFTRIQVLIFWP